MAPAAALARLVGPLALVATACAPPLEPAWLVTGPRELALDVVVTEQGPYGARIEPGPRTSRDALPLDTLTLSPAVVDADGVVDVDALDGVWVLCAGIGNCLLREPIRERPACDGQSFQPDQPCAFGMGPGPATLRIGDFPDEPVTDTTTILNLLTGPTVGYLASPPEGPGLDACMARLDAREPLAGCLLLERTLGVGPLGDLVDVLEALGIDSGLSDGADTLLARPRNRNPAVERLQLTFGDQVIEASEGDVVHVPRDETLRLTVLTSEEDLDAYEALVGEQRVLFSDDLSGQWWFDEELELTDPLPGSLTVELQAGRVTGVVRAYVVIRDNLGGEGWGSLALDFGG